MTIRRAEAAFEELRAMVREVGAAWGQAMEAERWEAFDAKEPLAHEFAMLRVAPTLKGSGSGWTVGAFGCAESHWIYLSIYRSIDRSIDPSIYLSIYLIIYLSIYLSIGVPRATTACCSTSHSRGSRGHWYSNRTHALPQQPLLPQEPPMCSPAPSPRCPRTHT